MMLMRMLPPRPVPAQFLAAQAERSLAPFTKQVSISPRFYFLPIAARPLTDATPPHVLSSSSRGRMYHSKDSHVRQLRRRVEQDRAELRLGPLHLRVVLERVLGLAR